MDRAIGVAERDPARFSVDSTEIERRKKWTASTRNQVAYPSFYLNTRQRFFKVRFLFFSSIMSTIQDTHLSSPNSADLILSNNFLKHDRFNQSQRS